MFIILAFAYVLLGNNFRASKTLPVEVASARNLKVDPKNIDCKVSVPYPADTAPIRSPQEVHSIIATKTLNRTIVEIGTRNGDGMTCFAKFAGSASAVEYDEKYCKKLERRATRERVPFEIQCQDFNLADLDADFITWWQQHPLTNLATLARLKQLKCLGKVRPSAEAIPIFDMQWPRDMEDFLELKPWFSWHEEVQFDEFDLCEKFKARGDEGSEETGFSCERSHGKFIVAGIPVANIPNSILACPTQERTNN